MESRHSLLFRSSQYLFFHKPPSSASAVELNTVDDGLEYHYRTLYPLDMVNIMLFRQFPQKLCPSYDHKPGSRIPPTLPIKWSSPVGHKQVRTRADKFVSSLFLRFKMLTKSWTRQQHSDSWPLLASSSSFWSRVLFPRAPPLHLLLYRVYMYEYAFLVQYLSSTLDTFTLGGGVLSDTVHTR